MTRNRQYQQEKRQYTNKGEFIHNTAFKFLDCKNSEKIKTSSISANALQHIYFFQTDFHCYDLGGPAPDVAVALSALLRLAPATPAMAAKQLPLVAFCRLRP
ncbi:MAG: hypothetical protein MJZ46_02390 [Bacteroidales bacterium]|nr:hypothetical protein [Bacteroidales bacterium]